MKIAFVDIETTGLDPHTHDVWEMAGIVSDTEELDKTTEFHHFIVPNLQMADPGALRMNHFYDRVELTSEEWGKNGERYKWSDPRAAALDVVTKTSGAYLCGMNVDFDADFLEHLLFACGLSPAWEYKPVELESMMLGYLSNLRDHEGVPTVSMSELFPFRSSDLSRRIGIDPDIFDRHTAMGDAKWAYSVFRKITGL